MTAIITNRSSPRADQSLSKPRKCWLADPRPTPPDPPDGRQQPGPPAHGRQSERCEARHAPVPPYALRCVAPSVGQHARRAWSGTEIGLKAQLAAAIYLANQARWTVSF